MNTVQLGSTVLIQSCDCFIIVRYETYCSDYLPPCGRVLLQKLVIFSYSRNYQSFMEPKVSLWICRTLGKDLILSLLSPIHMPPLPLYFIYAFQIFYPSDECYVSCPTRHLWFDLPLNVWCRVQIMQLLNILFPLASCHIHTPS